MSDTVVTVYSKKPCVQCDATFRKLDGLGVDYKVADATTEENLTYLKDLGYQQAPVVTVEKDGFMIDSWSGYIPDKVLELV